MIRKLLLVTAAFLFAVVVGFGLRTANAYAAAKKVDCSKVMSELQGGKKVKEVAKDLSISTSSVYRCRRAAKASSMKKTANASKTEATKPSSSTSPKASTSH